MPTVRRARNAEGSIGRLVGPATKLFKRAEVTAWVLLVVITVGLGFPAIRGPELGEPMSGDDLETNLFAYGLANGEQFQGAVLGGSPTIDLAPTPAGVLHGQIRIPYVSAPALKSGREPVLKFVLPRTTIIDPHRALSTLSSDYSGELNGGEWKCRSSRSDLSVDMFFDYQDDTGRDRRRVYSDMFHISCGDPNQVTVLAYPPGGLEAKDIAAARLGSGSKLSWAPILDFRVEPYPGIYRETSDTWRYLVEVDQALLGDEAVFQYPASQVKQPVLSITPWNAELDLSPDVPPDVSMPHYAEFGSGTALATTIKSDQTPLVASGSISDGHRSILEKLTTNVMFMFFLGLLAGQLQPFIKRGLERLPPWKGHV